MQHAVTKTRNTWPHNLFIFLRVPSSPTYNYYYSGRVFHAQNARSGVKRNYSFSLPVTSCTENQCVYRWLNGLDRISTVLEKHFVIVASSHISELLGDHASSLGGVFFYLDAASCSLNIMKRVIFNSQRIFDWRTWILTRCFHSHIARLVEVEVSEFA